MSFCPKQRHSFSSVCREQRGTRHEVVHESNNPLSPLTEPVALTGVTVLLEQHLSCCGFLAPPIFQQPLHPHGCTRHMVSVTAQLQTMVLSEPGASGSVRAIGTRRWGEHKNSCRFQTVTCKRCKTRSHSCSLLCLHMVVCVTGSG